MPPNPAAGDPSAAGKRKAPPAPRTGRSDAFMAKRAKVFAARSIPTQPADVALRDGELDLAAFVAAHEFEIRALEQSMATTKAVSCSRAFQVVPRSLRRRTASHNPKRVPKRLRARAAREMDEDNAPLVQARRRRPRTLRGRIRAQARKRLYLLAARKAKRKARARTSNADDKSAEEGGTAPTTTTKTDTAKKQQQQQQQQQQQRKPRPKIRRNALNEPPKPPAKFRRRQINKTWLPTHRWHAKRARMTPPMDPLWRFAIPLTPNEKIYRPAHRAQGQRGTLVWDMSYMSTIGVYGNPAGMQRVLRRIGVAQESCWNERGARWRRGTRAWTGMLSSCAGVEGVQRYMCPATVFWNPQAEGQAQTQPASTEESAEGQGKEKEKDKEKEKEKQKAQSQVYIRVHPAAFLEVFNELLRLTKMENPRLYIEDLRFEIGSIDLSGPASTEALHAILTPHPSSRSTPHADLFRSLRGLSNPSALPANAILHLAIQDPRLRYPPRKPSPPSPDAHAADMALLKTIAAWPADHDPHPTPSALFDRNARHAATCLPSQKAINRRRSRANPGAFLKPVDPLDPPIPVMLLATRSGTHVQAQGTWTLLAPWACILPLWYSLVHTPLSSGANPRFAGLREVWQVAFERGLPSFPADYPGTSAGREWAAELARKRRWEWARRPKSKKVAWDALDLGAGRKGELGDGLACDFAFLFSSSSSRGAEEPAQPQKDVSESNVVPPADADAMEIDGPAADAAPQPESESEPKALADDPPLTHIPKSTFNALTSSILARPIPPRAIICVRISILGRGIARPCARIYCLPSPSSPSPPSLSNPSPSDPLTSIPPKNSPLPHDLRAQWLARIPSSSSSSSYSSAPSSSSSSLDARRRRLAAELLQPPPPDTLYTRPNQHSIDGGAHPLVPDAKDLVGFVTTGSFCLADGAGRAVGGIALEKVLGDLGAGGRARGIAEREARLCVVRNAGENVGWLARWEVI